MENRCPSRCCRLAVVFLLAGAATCLLLLLLSGLTSSSGHLETEQPNEALRDTSWFANSRDKSFNESLGDAPSAREDEQGQEREVKLEVQTPADADLDLDLDAIAERLRQDTLQKQAPFVSSQSAPASRGRRALRPERKPILNEFSFPANLVQGMRFVLMCQVLDGEAPVQIKWFKDNQELDGTKLLQVSSNHNNNNFLDQVELLSNDELGSSLLFRRVEQQHSGNYTCLASNHFGSAAYSSIMSVKVPPRWKVEPQDQESIMGEQITIDCQAFGIPNPFIRWKFTSFHTMGQQTSTELSGLQAQQQISAVNDLQLQQQQNYKLINSNHHVQTLENGSLAIRQAGKEHEGLYLCEADNGVEPNLVKALRLVVHQQAQFVDEIQVLGGVEQQPALVNQLSGFGAGEQSAGLSAAAQHHLQTSPKAVRVAHNASQVRMLCQPFGDPPLSLDWLKDGQLIYTHSMALVAADSSPSGSSSSAANVGFLNQPPSAGSGEQLTKRYHVNTRRASAATRPQQLVGALESELVVTSVRRGDAGTFSCVARNAFGQAERKLRLVVQEPPEAPEVVDVAHIASRSISLRWLAPFDGNSPILKYVVEYRKQQKQADQTSQQQQQQLDAVGSTLQPATGQSEKMMPLKGALLAGEQVSVLQPQLVTGAQQQQQVQHTVHDLEPLTRYSMRVIAVNAVGRSKPSVALSLRTEEEVPSVVPSPVEVVVLSSRSIRLIWTVSYSPDHEIIDGFFVGYRSFDTSSSANSPDINGSNNNNNNGVGNLKPNGDSDQHTFTYKTIRLTSQQPAPSGDLDPGGDSSSSLLAPISSLTKSISGQTSPAPFSLVPGASHLQQQQQAQPQVIVVSAFEYLINGLERNTEYSILIQCFNKKGAGPTSDPVVFKTFMNDPPEKLILGADEISESSVKVSWRFIGSNGLPDQLHPGISSKGADLVDGYVLTFARLASRAKQSQSNQKGSTQRLLHYLPTSEHQSTINANDTANNNNNSSSISSISSGSSRILTAAARISNASPGVMHQQSSSLIQQMPTISGADQWQAIQLAPQQRSHQLKNLECGASYAMKIWAFNKIGKGEPSDLVTVSTRGKAPVAPDRRSFISVNSTQVRLHLSAWYDGGCEIDKFIVQYRARGQQEWLLVSNNILREQVSVVIRDLIPATSYELLVTAQNQVGPTEVKYRFSTLDSDGKQVQPIGFLGGLPSLDEPPDFDYTDSDGTRRSELWPSADSAGYKSLMMFRHLLNTPLALILSLCLFVALLLLLIFYRFNGPLTSSSITLSSSNKSPTSHGRRSSAEANTTIIDGTEPDSPRLNLAPSSRRPFGQPAECHYQSFCGLQADRSGQASVQQQPDYGSRSMVGDCGPYQLPEAYGQVGAGDGNSYSLVAPTNYAAVQRSTTMDLAMGNGGHQQDQHEQQCLMQMLSMGAQQQQQQQQEANNARLMAAALTTMARTGSGANKLKMVHNHHSQLPAGYCNAPSLNATLGRQQQHVFDFQQRLQQTPTAIPGKQRLEADESLIQALNGSVQDQSNDLLITSLANNEQSSNNRQADHEVYPMSTFSQRQVAAEQQHQQQLLFAAGANIGQPYCGSVSASSTSGCGTASSSSQLLVTPADQLSAPPNGHHEGNLLFIDSAEKCQQQQQQQQQQLESIELHPANFDLQLTCDMRATQYDVPFKFSSGKQARA